MDASQRVLVAIMNNKADFKIARDRHWYRIPVDKAHKWVGDAWPPSWLAFYQTKLFGDEAYSVKYYSKVLDVREAYRWELFPDAPRDGKFTKLYYQLKLGELLERPQPIFSRRFRRITFIPTVWHKFIEASEINDLYNGSPLEDRLWAELKRLQISAERQEFVRVKRQSYALDFAMHCVRGNLNVEADGDIWHSDPKRIARDNRRDNDLETADWKLLRFSTTQINAQMRDYCVPTILENINTLGGIEEQAMAGNQIRASL